MSVYINGIGIISPQETIDNNKFLEKIYPFDKDYFKMIEPAYKEYIAPRDLRRMSKILRNGIVAGKIALKESQLAMPQAIITGTGLGCAIDTEKFLIKMIENKEKFLTPSSFIQSTHNTLGGSIAIGLGCHEYNMTYVHRGFSFETALLDAQMMMQTGEINNALVGGFDEMTDNHIQLLQATEMYKPNSGTVAGQVSGFFVLENEKKSNSYAKLLDLEMIYKPKQTVSTVSGRIEKMLLDHKINKENLVIVMGYNGVKAEENVYQSISKQLFEHQSITHFKHLSGESYTASAFAFWMAAQMLKKQNIPQAILYSEKRISKIENVLIYNQYQKTEHSLMLLGKC